MLNVIPAIIRGAVARRACLSFFSIFRKTAVDSAGQSAYFRSTVNPRPAGLVTAPLGSGRGSSRKDEGRGPVAVKQAESVRRQLNFALTRIHASEKKPPVYPNAEARCRGRAVRRASSLVFLHGRLAVPSSRHGLESAPFLRGALRGGRQRGKRMEREKARMLNLTDNFALGGWL